MSATSDAVSVEVPDIGDFDGRPDHRDPGLARRHRRGRRSAADARVRQGDDGRAGAGRRDRPRAAGEDRRQGLPGGPAADARDADGDGDASAQAGGGHRRAPGRGRRRGRERGAGRGREPAPPAPSRAAAGRAPAPPPRPAAPEGNGGGPVYASPAVRRIARELGVDLHQVTGSGRKGRITKEDVRGVRRRGPPAPAAAAAAGARSLGLDLPPWPSVDFSKFGPSRARRSARGSSGSRRRTWPATG